MKDTARFLGRRLIKSLVVLAVIAIFNFFLVRAAPGDPAELLAGMSGAADAETVAKIRADIGLDKPILTQLGNYLGDVATLDLGFSMVRQEPVLNLILAHIHHLGQKDLVGREEF